MLSNIHNAKQHCHVGVFAHWGLEDDDDDEEDGDEKEASIRQPDYSSDLCPTKKLAMQLLWLHLCLGAVLLTIEAFLLTSEAFSLAIEAFLLSMGQCIY